MQAYRADLLHFKPDAPPEHSADLIRDGLLVTAPDAQGVQRVLAIGPYTALRPSYPEVPLQHFPGRVLAPGFVDAHVHYPQLDAIASPAAGLLPWLEHHIFPQEQRFASRDHAQEAADFFVDELLRHGVTTALAFATSHPVSVEAGFTAAQQRGLRFITGLCLMDRNAPPGLLNAPSRPGAGDATEHSLQQSQALIQRWHGQGRLGYAMTPRFAPTSTPAQLAGCGELARAHPDVWVQSHVAENRDEVAWVAQLFPQARSYLDVYDQAGLLRPRAVYAHCIHLDDTDRRRLAQTGAAAAVCPSSNAFLGSGFFDYRAAQAAGMNFGLASDVGAGTSLSPFRTMLAAYLAAREGQTKPGLSLSPQHLWWQHTVGAARALGLEGVVGNLTVGCEADWVLLHPQATPLLARRTARAQTLDEWLFALIVLGDERVIERTQVASSRQPAEAGQC